MSFHASMNFFILLKISVVINSLLFAPIEGMSTCLKISMLSLWAEVLSINVWEEPTSQGSVGSCNLSKLSSKMLWLKVIN